MSHRLRPSFLGPVAFLLIVGIGALGAPGAAVAAPAPPPITVLSAGATADRGAIFVAPFGDNGEYANGPEIVDGTGKTIWFRPIPAGQEAADFRTQTYRGRPVLTWWQGTGLGGLAQGTDYVYDRHYHQIAEVHAGNGYSADGHEFLITPWNTALILVYTTTTADLTSIGGPANQRVIDGIVQEIDIPTRRVLFEWHSYPEIGIQESYSKPPKKQLGTKPFPYDYVHLNSIDVEPNGNLLVSGRNTHAVYEISRRTGKVIWRLGGKKSDFKLGPGARFAWQHDARRQPDGTITMFDNGAAPPVEKFSRILVLRADTKTKRATLVRSYRHPRKLLAPFEGNAQFLPDGHVFVGWGGWPYATEFARNGRVLWDAYFGHGKPPGEDADSYRAYRFVWHGHPTDRPALAVKQRPAVTTLYASWNGATEVARWAVYAGDNMDKLSRIGTWSKSGFETAITVQNDAKFFAVEALNKPGRALSRSAAVAAKG